MFITGIIGIVHNSQRAETVYVSLWESHTENFPDPEWRAEVRGQVLALPPACSVTWASHFLSLWPSAPDV